MSYKACILVGGPQKGTRFRPLSLQLPKPLFPIAGVPLVEHHIDQLAQLPALSEIILLGFYPSKEFVNFCDKCQQQFRIPVRYVQEPTPLGTAGGIGRIKEEILNGSPEGVFIINGDVCGDLPVVEMTEQLTELSQADCLLLTTEATREQSTNFGCAVVGANERVVHYVDKPTTFISVNISCGVYLMRPNLIEVDKTAKIGPNVSIGPNAKIGKGARIKESIVLAEAMIDEHACVMHAVIGWRSIVGAWARVEGVPLAPNPNIPFAKMEYVGYNGWLENRPLFNTEGRLTPSVTILGSDVNVAPETLLLNCVVLPYKELSTCHKNQIIL